MEGLNLAQEFQHPWREAPLGAGGDPEQGKCDRALTRKEKCKGGVRMGLPRLSLDSQ